jgi:dihydroorotate dehydrogenase electron transfer subunit
VIEKAVQESSNIRSFYFKDPESLLASPGEFVMVWAPGAGEFPMSLSLPRKGLASIGVKAMGPGSKRLYEIEPGSKIGLRGPYGKPFDLTRVLTSSDRLALLAGGGTGLVPMLVLGDALAEENAKVSAVISARTKSELPFLRAFQKLLGESNVYPTTDDGSLGFHGLGHQKVAQLVEENNFDEIFSCGPERMMASIYEIAQMKKVNVQFSLERIMKCGIGICGSCTVGDIVLCRDGPVLNEKEVSWIAKEFGKSYRNKAGALCPI